MCQGQRLEHSDEAVSSVNVPGKGNVEMGNINNLIENGSPLDAFYILKLSRMKNMGTSG